MRNPKVQAHIHALKQRLDSLFDLARDLPEDPLEIRSHWAKYLCVLTSGFLETSIRALYVAYARGKSSPGVANYVEARLRFFVNPDMRRITALAKEFSPDWADEIEAGTTGQIAEAVNSIVGNRNAIAHGDPSSITLAEVARYYADAVRLVEIIERQCETER